MNRLFVPLPDAEARKVLLKNLLKGEDFALRGKYRACIVNSQFGMMCLCPLTQGHRVFLLFTGTNLCCSCFSVSDLNRLVQDTDSRFPEQAQ